jgi:hypothetical protein
MTFNGGAGKTEVEAVKASDEIGDEKPGKHAAFTDADSTLFGGGGAGARYSLSDEEQRVFRPMGRSLADNKGKYRISCITFKEWAEEKRLTLSALKRILFSLCVWFAYLWSMYGHTRVKAQFMVKDAITDDLMNIVTPSKAALLMASSDDGLSDCGTVCGVGGSEGGVRLSTVRDADDVWMWITYGLIPRLYSEERLSEAEQASLSGVPLRRLAHWNQILGLRISQMRARKTSCGLAPSLQNWYGHQCHTTRDGYASEWESDGHKGTVPQEGPHFKSEIRPTPLYEGSFPMFSADLTLTKTVQELKDEALVLSTQGWIDEYTAQLRTELPYVSAEIGCMGIIFLTFTFERGGAIDVDILVRVVPITEFAISWSYYADLILFLAILYVLAVEMKTLRMALKEEDSCKEAIKDNYCTMWPKRTFAWMVILGGFVALLMYHILDARFATLAGRIADSGDWRVILDEMLDAIFLYRYHRMGLFWYSMLLLAYWVQSFIQQPRLAVLLQTLALAGQDILHFLLIFMVIFFNFVVGGHILFGTKLPEWSTLLLSVSSTFRALMGSFDYAALYQIAPVAASCWFWLFIITMSLLLFNLLIAIMLEHYQTMCKRTGFTNSLFQQVWESFTDVLFWLRHDVFPRCIRRIRRKEHDDIPRVVSVLEVIEMGKMICSQHDVRITKPKMGFVDLRIGHKIEGLGRSLTREQTDSAAAKSGDELEDIAAHITESLKEREGTALFDFDALAISPEQRDRIREQVQEYKAGIKSTYEEVQLDIVAGFAENVATQVKMLKKIMSALEEESEESVVDVTNKIEAIEQVLEGGFAELNLFGGILTELKRSVKRSLSALHKQQNNKSSSSPLSRSQTRAEASPQTSPKALGN